MFLIKQTGSVNSTIFWNSSTQITIFSPIFLAIFSARSSSKQKCSSLRTLKRSIQQIRRLLSCAIANFAALFTSKLLPQRRGDIIIVLRRKALKQVGSFFLTVGKILLGNNLSKYKRSFHNALFLISNTNIIHKM